LEEYFVCETSIFTVRAGQLKSFGIDI